MITPQCIGSAGLRSESDDRKIFRCFFMSESLSPSCKESGPKLPGGAARGPGHECVGGTHVLPGGPSLEDIAWQDTGSCQLRLLPEPDQRGQSPLSP